MANSSSAFAAPPPWLALVDRSSFAAVAAAEVVNAIVERGGDLLYDAYLRQREAPFVVARTTHSLRLLAEWQLPQIDGAELRGPETAHHGHLAALPSTATAALSATAHLPGSWTCEAEPLPAPLDSWARSSIPTRVPLQRRRGLGGSGADRDSRSAGAAAASSADGQALLGRNNAGAAAAAAAAAGLQLYMAPIDEGEGEDKGDSPASKSKPAAPASAAARTSGSSPTSASAADAGAASVSPIDSAEKARVVAALEKKRRQGDEDKAREAEEARERAERDKVFSKKLRGKSYTVDEIGGILLVEKPNPDRLPAVVLPVNSVELDFGRGPASSPSTAHTATARGGVGAGTARSSSGVAGGSSERAAALPPPVSERDRVSHAALASARGDPRFFKNSVTAQPSLIDANPTLVAGVTIREEDRVLQGPPIADDPEHMTRHALSESQRLVGGGSSTLSQYQSQSAVGAAGVQGVGTGYGFGGFAPASPQGSLLLQASTMDTMLDAERRAPLPHYTHARSPHGHEGHMGHHGHGDFTSSLLENSLSEDAYQGPEGSPGASPAASPSASVWGVGAGAGRYPAPAMPHPQRRRPSPPHLGSPYAAAAATAAGPPTSTAALLGQMYGALGNVAGRAAPLLQEAQPMQMIRANQAFDGDLPLSAAAVAQQRTQQASAGGAFRGSEDALAYSLKSGNRLMTRAAVGQQQPLVGAGVQAASAQPFPSGGAPARANKVGDFVRRDLTSAAHHSSQALAKPSRRPG